jgi:hypothetical protein
MIFVPNISPSPETMKFLLSVYYHSKTKSDSRIETTENRREAGEAESNKLMSNRKQTPAIQDIDCQKNIIF